MKFYIRTVPKYQNEENTNDLVFAIEQDSLNQAMKQFENGNSYNDVNIINLSDNRQISLIVTNKKMDEVRGEVISCILTIGHSDRFEQRLLRIIQKNAEFLTIDEIAKIHNSYAEKIKAHYE